MSVVGYEFLRQHLGLAALPPRRIAVIKPVTRIERSTDRVAIPATVAPSFDDPLAHLLFALKHEGTDLAILIEALGQIPASRLLAELARTPSGAYIRQACFLWEHANNANLDDAPPPSGTVTPLFDPDRYVTGPGQRNARWRVDFNGLGTLDYCATVERTDAVQAGLDADLPGRANHYAASLGGVMRDRALAWAYLHETRDSFAIEREAPSEDRARAFVALLHQAHERRPLDEDYLVDLQQATVSNAYDRAAGFRQEQNWLQGPLRGAAGITYVPPPPELVVDLMDGLMAFANHAPDEVPALVNAAIVSFGFVFIHPFMDGNGRLSRFLFHHALCRAGALQDGLILPVSVAMKKHEVEYLRTLQEFSRPVRERWKVEWLDEGRYAFDYRGDPRHGIYRYWDATEAVEFSFRMAEQALEVELRSEAEFLASYDAITRQVNERFDLRGSDLATLVLSAWDHQGKVSKRRRDQFRPRVPEAAFDFIEEVTTEALRNNL
ncbi:Fic family protein [Novilysobacter erysipheiresistens]|uniref:Fic family protein n=1 Tax=Novilysobacter erysipheiresistens TaxID=1749332 RepID=A0ABU7YYQ8_9GAMM